MIPRSISSIQTQTTCSLIFNVQRSTPASFSNALVVYRDCATHLIMPIRSAIVRLIHATFAVHLTKEALLPPLFEPSEAHFYPLSHTRPHTHTSAPFTSQISISIHVASNLPHTPCKTAKSHLCTCAWTVGVLSVALAPAAPGWAVGIVVRVLFSALGEYERGGTTPHHLSRCNTDAYNEALMLCVSKSISMSHAQDFASDFGSHLRPVAIEGLRRR